MTEFTGKLTVGSFEAFPNARLQPMPWSLRSVSPWGYYENNTLIDGVNTGLKDGSLTNWSSENAVGIPPISANLIKPLAGTVHLTAYDYQARPTSRYVPVGSKVFVDGVQVAVIGDVGFASFSMHAGDPHVVRVDMVDPFWGVGYVSHASVTATVLLDATIDLVLNVPRARFEPWTYNISAVSNYNGGTNPVGFSLFEDNVFVSSAPGGNAQANPVDDLSHVFDVIINDPTPHSTENYSISVVGVYGGSVLAQFQSVPPHFSFTQRQNVINAFSIGPTSGVVAINHPDTVFNQEPFDISSAVVGNITSVEYSITIDGVTAVHAATGPDYKVTITPSVSSTPDQIQVIASFTDATGGTGQYAVPITIHSKHLHQIFVTDDSSDLVTPRVLPNASVYVNGILKGVTDSAGTFSVSFDDENVKSIRVTSNDPDTGVDPRIFQYTLNTMFDTTSTQHVSFSWSPATPPLVFSSVVRDNGTAGQLPISGADVSVDGVVVTRTAADGSFSVTFPNNQAHVLSITAEDPLKIATQLLSWSGTFAFTSGSTNRLPMIVLTWIVNTDIVAPKKIKAVDFKNLSPALLSPVFGPEKETYLRLVYGTTSRPFGGLTPGRFYDLRALPLPYQKFDKTWFQLEFVDIVLDGQVVDIVVDRKSPVEDTSAHMSITLSYPITLFSVRLGKGANSIRVVAPNGFELARISVVATRYASYLHALALEIFSNTWQKLETLGTSIFGPNPTALTAPLIGFDEQLPHPPNMNQIARRFIVDAMMNLTGSSQGISKLVTALLGSAPIFSKHERRGLNESWIDGAMSYADQMNGLEIGVWSPNLIASRWSNFSRLAWNTGNEVTTYDPNVRVDLQEHDFSELNEPIVRSYDDGTEWIELVLQEETSVFDFWPHNRSHAFVQAPGLFDYERSYFDTGSLFDSGHEFDTINKSLDPKHDGYVGVAITPGPLYHVSDSPPVGILSLSASDFGFSIETQLLSSSMKETILWTAELVKSLSDSSMFNAQTLLALPNVPASSGELADPVIGMLVELRSLTSGHEHLPLTLTKGQRSAIKAGTPLIVLSQNPSDPLVAAHQHALTISWRDGWVISMPDNHGHEAFITE